ncbi:auxin-responsive protein SAUR19-like [Hevea brasiliensis]|uniref:auxin-responsive protein SAUR19-like n=1 Tax=Hevea brasiliensis TaxID=3981 RepID=UPI0025DC2B25|nr:auxin-responsive protein SAUR19-like [Hevea brasiliensis]
MNSSIYIHTRLKYLATKVSKQQTILLEFFFLTLFYRSIKRNILARNLAAVLAKQIMHRSTFAANKATSITSSIPKGYLAAYIGETEKTRFVIPISYLKEPSFQDLLSKAEEEHGFVNS